MRDLRHALERAVLPFIKEERLITPGDTIGCAVSGGADSLALLWFLVEFRDRLGIEVEVLHVHHGIPEARSDEAADAVRELARRLNLRCRILRADVPLVAVRRQLGVEAAGRLVRYRWFRRLTAERPHYRVATAHTLQDQAETVLMRILRGCGIRGLRGIRPRLHRGHVIRPFLTVARSFTYYVAGRLDWPLVEDPTNDDPGYSRRNWVRHVLLPTMDSSDVFSSLWRLSQAARHDEAYLATQARHAFQELAHVDPTGCEVGDALAHVAPALQPRVWRRAVRAAGLDPRRLEADHLLLLDYLLHGAAGRRVTLPGGGDAQRTYVGVRLQRQAHAPAPDLMPVVLELPGIMRDYNRCLIYALDVPVASAAWTCDLDADRVGEAGALQVRSRRPGDRWVPPGHSKPQKVKKWLNRWRIPPSLRDLIPILAAGPHIVALIGHAVDARFAARPDSGRTLRLEVRPLEDGESGRSSRGSDP